MVSHLNPLWPTLFAAAVISLAIREIVHFRKSPDLATSSNFFSNCSIPIRNRRIYRHHCSLCGDRELVGLANLLTN